MIRVLVAVGIGAVIVVPAIVWLLCRWIDRNFWIEYRPFPDRSARRRHPAGNRDDGFQFTYNPNTPSLRNGSRK